MITNDHLKLLILNYWRKCPQYFDQFEWLVTELTATMDLEQVDQSRLAQLIEELEEVDHDQCDPDREISAQVITVNDMLKSVFGDQK